VSTRVCEGPSKTTVVSRDEKIINLKF